MKKKIILIVIIILIIIIACLGYFLLFKNKKASLELDMTNWNYDETNNVYYKLGVQYSSKPETLEYETMGIYVPGEYFDSKKNNDGTYTVKVNSSGEKAGYTSAIAPIILPVDTPGYSGQKAPTEYNYNSIKDYMEAGYIYVLAGMRGRGSMQGSTENQDYSGGAPYGVTDLKAAIRYYRYNQEELPGNTESIFSYGMSGGGAQSALIGATGDSELYYPYLKSIGAAMTDKNGNPISDAIAGSMAWCPITSLDIADAAYEWNMGQFFNTDTRAENTFTSELSKDLAEAFAVYINAMGLKDEEGNVLKLEKTEDGVYMSGSYYEYILSEIETSLNNFLSDTSFPYTYTSSKIQAGNTAESGQGMISGGNIGDRPNGDMSGNNNENREFRQGGMGNRNFGGSSQNSLFTEGTEFETAEDYIDALNKNQEWVKYNSKTNTVEITSIEAFVSRLKSATKSVGAFDSVEAGQGENNLFGNGQNENKHFDLTLYNLLKNNQQKYSTFSDWNSKYITSFESDINSKDKLGVDMETRVNMYNPLYYLSDYYDGNNTSTVAKYWRIRTGINQTDTALTTEINLKLALESNSNVESVDFATVWGQTHTTAERTGTSTENFINWVNDCLK